MFRFRGTSRLSLLSQLQDRFEGSSPGHVIYASLRNSENRGRAVSNVNN